MVTVHYMQDGMFAACGRNTLNLCRSADKEDVTCKQCRKSMDAPELVGHSRDRAQYKVVCRGGPWGGSEAVFARQESGELSLPIRVGEHVGRYNLNTGHWVPLGAASMSEDQKFAEFLAGHFYLQELDTDKSAEGEYSDGEVQQAWEVWQSAREELATITADRDIKAANLRLLVENVLDYAAMREAAVGGENHIDTREAERLLSELTELARSLKQ